MPDILTPEQCEEIAAEVAMLLDGPWKAYANGWQIPEMLETIKALRKWENQLRREWWVNHRCSIAAAYGDDGEMSCNAATCMKDFKRESMDELMTHVQRRRLIAAAGDMTMLEEARATITNLRAVALICKMCGAPAVCLSVDNEPPARAMFACGDCCGCGACANVHDADNPYCEAETGGCWRLVAIPNYVNQLRDDLNALDETTASQINELREEIANLRAVESAAKRVLGALDSWSGVIVPSSLAFPMKSLDELRAALAKARGDAAPAERER